MLGGSVAKHCLLQSSGAYPDVAQAVVGMAMKY